MQMSAYSVKKNTHFLFDYFFFFNITILSIIKKGGIRNTLGKKKYALERL